MENVILNGFFVKFFELPSSISQNFFSNSFSGRVMETKRYSDERFFFFLESVLKDKRFSK